MMAATPLLVPITLLLAVGGIAGHSDDLVRRLPGFDRELAKTVAMRLSLGCATLATIAMAGAAIWHLVGCTSMPSECAQPQPELLVPLAGPIDGLDLGLTVRLDGLAALFLLLVAVCGGCIAVYSYGWLAHNPLRHSVAGSFCLFLFATAGTVLVDNAFWLLVALELMTLSSADLVRYAGRTGGAVGTSRTAVRTYLLMSHAGLVCLMAGLLPILVEHRELGLMALGDMGGSPAPVLSFALVLLGLGIRAGITPFHSWVPTVHPQLPTNTHAVMSAVMLKIPVYLMVRFFFEGVIGPITWWWGAALLIVAGMTAVVTVFYALVSTDLKVALAYHSVENLGIILAGLGLALVLSDEQFGPASRGTAAVALVASLYHVVNHALFKSLLFLGTGAIERQVGTVQLRQLGGLLRGLPWTAVTFLIGAVAIAGLPPLNGFVSEWLTLQSIFASQGIYRSEADAPVSLFIMAAFVIALVTLGMAFAATALAFAKISGEALLGELRSAGRPPREAWSMRAAMAVLAILCLALGVQPWLLVPWLHAAIRPMEYETSALTASPTTFAIDLGTDGGYRADLSMRVLLALAGLPLVLIVLLRAWRWPRRPVWAGGTPFVPETMRYTGTALSGLFWEPLATPSAAWASRQPSSEGDEHSRAGAVGQVEQLPSRVRLSARRRVLDVTHHLYTWLLRRATAISESFGNRVQGGDIRSYLLYIFVTGIVVLAVLAVMR